MLPSDDEWVFNREHPTSEACIIAGLSADAPLWFFMAATAKAELLGVQPLPKRLVTRLQRLRKAAERFYQEAQTLAVMLDQAGAEGIIDPLCAPECDEETWTSE